MSVSKWLASCASLLIAFSVSNVRAAVGDVGTFTAPERSFFTATYWIEGVDGVILIDTQFLPKEGVQALELAEKSAGKKVVAAIVLHPNPDKFNGTAELQKRGIKVMTSKQVKALIPSVHQIRLSWFFEDYKPDYPNDAANPDVFGEQATDITLAGVPLKLHVLGRGASGAHVVVQHGANVFVGDLINPKNHAWLELGFIDDWLVRLTEIKAMNPTKIYPGRGPVGGASMIDTQATYLKRVQQIVRDENPSGELGNFTKLKMQWKIEREFPQLTLPIFMRDGLMEVWRSEGKRR